MPWYEGDGAGWWVIFPIVFMAFMMIMMFRMMGGGHRHGADGESGGPGRSSPDGGGAKETPLEVAQRRYASGEIRREEYQRIRDDLG